MADKTKVVESTEIKFTDEELQSLQKLQDDYQAKQATLGQLAVQRILLDQQGEALAVRVTEIEQEYLKHLDIDLLVVRFGRVSKLDLNSLSHLCDL